MNNPTLIAKSAGSLREAFGKSITKIARINKKIVILDADLAGGTGCHHFLKKYPKRFFQCGIAEQNMISVSAGMASLGLIPFATTFAVFALRAFEQARLSISYTNLNVKIVASHGGLDTGPDGASAQCIEDLACFRSLPNFVVLSPCDSNEMFQAVKTIAKHKGPVYMRTGRSNVENITKPARKFVIGKGLVLNKGKKICIISTGMQSSIALKAIKKLKKLKKISPTLIHMPTIKPIDKELLIKMSKKHKVFITFEDHNIFGGLGSAVSEVLSENAPNKIIRMGIRDKIGKSGEAKELLKEYKIDGEALINQVKKIYK
jgi:transketolase